MTGACKPALSAMSTKRALNGRPEAAGLGTGFTVWGETPWANRRPACEHSAALIPSSANFRRVKFMRNTLCYLIASRGGEELTLRPACHFVVAADVEIFATAHLPAREGQSRRS